MGRCSPVRRTWHVHFDTDVEELHPLGQKLTVRSGTHWSVTLSRQVALNQVRRGPSRPRNPNTDQFKKDHHEPLPHHRRGARLDRCPWIVRGSHRPVSVRRREARALLHATGSGRQGHGQARTPSRPISRPIPPRRTSGPRRHKPNGSPTRRIGSRSASRPHQSADLTVDDAPVSAPGHSSIPTERTTWGRRLRPLIGTSGAPGQRGPVAGPGRREPSDLELLLGGCGSDR